MRKKYADYPNWDKVIEKSYKNKYFNDEYFKGNISLLTAVKVKDRIIRKNVAILDNNFKYLEFYPENNKNLSLMVCINNEDEILEWYFDIAKDSLLDKNGIPYIVDLYLDVTVSPNGEIKLLDEDELENALKYEDITKTDFDLAYFVADNLIKKLDGKIDELKDFTTKYYNIMRGIDNV